MKENNIERWMVCLLIRGSDQAKYGTLTKLFVSQYYLVNDQYTRSIMTATDALYNHKIDPVYYENQKVNRDKLRSNRDNRETDDEGNPMIFFQK